MITLHIANTNFETELEQPTSLSLIELLTKPKFAIQLQYLPLLYKEKDEGILATHKPKEILDNFYLITDYSFSKNDKIVSWGYSKSIAELSLKRGFNYNLYDEKTIKKVNSKIFSFEISPKLEGAKLIDNVNDIPDYGVLKNAYGFSARGHFHLDGKKDPKPFLLKEFSKGNKVIWEPWVDRVLDFSTQWFIADNGQISYLGATILKNHPGGSYLGTLCGDEKLLFGKYQSFLKDHIDVAKTVLEKVKAEGYLGNVGIDSMIYKDLFKDKLHPIVEINARKTLGYALLSYWLKNPTKEIFFSYFTASENAKRALLPSSVFLEDKKITFDRQLTFDLISPFL